MLRGSIKLEQKWDKAVFPKCQTLLKRREVVLTEVLTSSWSPRWCIRASRCSRRCVPAAAQWTSSSTAGRPEAEPASRSRWSPHGSLWKSTSAAGDGWSPCICKTHRHTEGEDFNEWTRYVTVYFTQLSKNSYTLPLFTPRLCAFSCASFLCEASLGSSPLSSVPNSPCCCIQGHSDVWDIWCQQPTALSFYFHNVSCCSGLVFFLNSETSLQKSPIQVT